MPKNVTLDNLKTFLEETDHRYVAQKTGYGLSSNDFEDVYKERLKSIEDNAEMNRINTVKLNNTIVKPDEQRAVNIRLPEASKSELGAVLGLKADISDDEESQYATIRDIQNLFSET